MSYRKIASAGALCLAISTACSVKAEEGDPAWYIDAGISYFMMDPNLHRDLTTHSTHPDDQSFMSGSPGNTELDDVDITFLNLEVGYARPITTVQVDYRWELGFSYVLKIPFSESGPEDKQNENDTRPATEGSFIYTALSEVALQHEVGLNVTYWQALGGNKFRFSITPGIYLGYWKIK